MRWQKMPKIRIHPTGEPYHYETGSSLLEILLAKNIFIDNPCNGKGICGKCRVRIRRGNVGAMTETEKKFLSQEEQKNGVRLACLIKPTQDLEIEILEKERKGKVLIGGYVPSFEFAPDLRKKCIHIKKTMLEDQKPYENQIMELMGANEISFKIMKGQHFHYGKQTAVLYKNKIISLEQGDTSESLYGVAIDIGTTTVVCSLVNMINGKECLSASRINTQKQFGLDVLTRITYEVEHPEDGVKKLQETIVELLNEMIEEVCSRGRIRREEIYEIVVSANCTMMHMLLGIDATSIGKAPYSPMFVRAREIEAKEIKLHVAECARLYCLPAVSSYIGADIVAGAYVCHLQKETGNVLFIDIGTNGEIVLSKGGKLLSCSCAAGPALEGMNISAGMRAAHGAIEDVKIMEQGVQLSVIGGEEPTGICGSGILSVVKELVRHNIVTKSGTFIKKSKLEQSDYRYSMIQMNGNKREFILMNKPKQLLITQGDIRQVQLAKGAILSGFQALLSKAELEMQDLDKVLIAGQFGAHLSADSLTGTGILPKEVEEKLVYVGNTSKTGAYMALVSGYIKTELQKLAEEIEYMELGEVEGYERMFAECLLFPEV